MDDQALQERYDELLDRHARLLADFDNHRKRTAGKAEEARLEGVKSVMLAVLPVLDDFERAFSHGELSGGGRLIYRKLMDTLGGLGLTRMDVDRGDEFNVDEHCAVGQVGNGFHIEEVTENGYRLNGEVIRYAKVIV